MATIRGVKSKNTEGKSLHLKRTKYIRRGDRYKYLFIFSLILNCVAVYLLQVHKLLF